MLLPAKPTYNPKNLLPSQDTVYTKKANAYVSEIKLLSGYIISIPFVLLSSYLFYNIANGERID